MATTASDLAAGQIAMVAAARYTQSHNTPFLNLVTKMTLDAGEKSKYIPKFGTAAAVDLTDGLDMTGESVLTITGTTHTTDEAGCKVIVTKKLRNQLKEDAYAAAGRVIGQAMAKKMEQDGNAILSGLDNGITAAATVMVVGYIAAAVSQCMGQAEPVPGKLNGYFHPYQINGIVDQLTVPSAVLTFPDSLSLPLLKDWWAGQTKLYNVNIFTSGYLANNTSGTTTGATGAIFSPSAFIYLVGWEPENWVEEDKSLRGWEIGVVADYGLVEEDGTYGRYMNFDNTAPTA